MPQDETQGELETPELPSINVNWFDVVGSNTITYTGECTISLPGFSFTPPTGIYVTGDGLVPTDNIWNSWITGGYTATTTTTIRPPTYRRTLRWNPSPTPEPTPEEIEERDRQAAQRREEYRRELEERGRQRAEAAQRAEELLLRVLTPAEREHYQESGRLVITGSDGRRYRIENGLVGNVFVLGDDGSDIERWCAHPREYDHMEMGIPTRDLHAGQVLALRCDAPRFLAVANLHWHREAQERQTNADIYINAA